MSGKCRRLLKLKMGKNPKGSKLDRECLEEGSARYGVMGQSHPLPIFFFNLFIYLWLCWVFFSVRGLSLVVASGATLHRGAPAFHHRGLSC